MFDAENFNPTALPFCLSWENFGKFKDFYKMSDAETTSILLAMVGPSSDGKILWSKYKLPKQYQDRRVARSRGLRSKCWRQIAFLFLAQGGKEATSEEGTRDAFSVARRVASVLDIPELAPKTLTDRRRKTFSGRNW